MPKKSETMASWELEGHRPKPPRETRVRRSVLASELHELALRPVHGVDTLIDMLQYAARTHGSKACMGSREVLDKIEVAAKGHALARTETRRSAPSRSSAKSSSSAGGSRMIERFRLGPYVWSSYDDVLRNVRDIGSGLRELGGGRPEGCDPQDPTSFFAMYGPTSQNWMTTALACAYNGVAITTVIDAADIESATKRIQRASCFAVFTDASMLDSIEIMLGSSDTRLKLVVYDGTPTTGQCTMFTRWPDVRFIALDKVRSLGAKSPCKPMEVGRDDVATVHYTSGSAGEAKGVVLTHGNMCAAVASGHIVADVLNNQEAYLAFLPQAHIFEFAVELIMIVWGVPIAYGRVATLTDNGVVDCNSDIMEARPTMMIAVPQVWELMRKGILHKVAKSGTLKKSLFNVALKAKSAALASDLLPGVVGLTDTVVFNAVRKGTGGRLNTLISGGAPIAASTQKFLSLALVKMIQGYGMTEATAMACVQFPHMDGLDHVGGPAPGLEMKLVDHPTLGYYTSSSPPRGEVYMRGPAVFKGYFGDPGLNARTFTPDGWFKTGDIGQFNRDGTVTIVDRVKNHQALAGDNFVALERAEAVYKGAPFVFNGILVASLLCKQPCMIAVAHPEGLPALAKRHGIKAGPLDEMCADRALINLCITEMNALGRKAGLRKHELLEALVLVADEWTPESGLLTAAQKLRRAAILQEYRELVERVYRLPRSYHIAMTNGGAADSSGATFPNPAGSTPRARRSPSASSSSIRHTPAPSLSSPVTESEQSFGLGLGLYLGEGARATSPSTSSDNWPSPVDTNPTSKSQVILGSKGSGLKSSESHHTVSTPPLSHANSSPITATSPLSMDDDDSSSIGKHDPPPNYSPPPTSDLLLMFPTVPSVPGRPKRRVAVQRERQAESGAGV